MENWVILFARTGSEERLTRILRETLNADEYVPFLPVRETPRRSKGIIYKERKPLFPGYIFLQTGIDAGSIAKNLKTALTDSIGKRHNDIYKVLHYGDDKQDVAVREKERIYWERLFNADFCVTGSVGFIEGDTVRIISGPLTGMESRIRKINRHKREAVVEMEVMGSVRKVKLMLEIVKRVGIGMHAP